MRAGKLRHRVRFERRTTVQDPDSGERVPGWEPVVTVWASVEPLSSREFIAAQASQSEITARITIRHRTGIDATMRAVHRGQIYDIHGVLPDPKSGRHYLTLPVSEGVNDGS